MSTATHYYYYYHFMAIIQTPSALRHFTLQASTCVSVRTCVHADTCVSRDVCVSVVIIFIEMSDVVHTTRGSVHVRNTSRAQIELTENTDVVYTLTPVHTTPHCVCVNGPLADTPS